MDVPDCARARSLAEDLGDAVTFYKLGLELMMSGGYFDLLQWMLERDKKVFADLKFFDIPATVGSAVRQLKERGASFVTVHGNQSISMTADSIAMSKHWLYPGRDVHSRRVATASYPRDWKRQCCEKK